MTGVAPAAGLDVVQAVDIAVAAHRDDEGPLLEVLHSVQAELGWIPPEATRLVAERLNLSRADVHGVVTFYADFRDRPPAAHVLRVCAAEACQARGSRDLVGVSRATARCRSRASRPPDGSLGARQGLLPRQLRAGSVGRGRRTHLRARPDRDARHGDARVSDTGTGQGA